MNKFLKIVLITGTMIFGLVGIVYYGFLHIDLIGHKDPKVAEGNVKRWNNTLFSAKFRDGTNYCKVDLLDSINIEINVGDKSGGAILNEKYKLLKDTIVVIGGIKHSNKYLNSDKFFIQNRKLLYQIDKTGSFDTTKVMTVRFSKIKL